MLPILSGSPSLEHQFWWGVLPRLLVSVCGIVVHHGHGHGKALLLLEVQVWLLDHVSILTVHQTALCTCEVTLPVDFAVAHLAQLVLHKSFQHLSRHMVFRVKNALDSMHGVFYLIAVCSAVRFICGGVSVFKGHFCSVPHRWSHLKILDRFFRNFRMSLPMIISQGPADLVTCMFHSIKRSLCSSGIVNCAFVRRSKNLKWQGIEPQSCYPATLVQVSKV